MICGANFFEVVHSWVFQEAAQQGSGAAAAAVKEKQAREEAAWRAHEQAQQVGISSRSKHPRGVLCWHSAVHVST